ncbi:hypothetical protein CJ195_03685 [Bacillus sp. UMB0899]|uniref:hypothetical protein n=1 Tax=Metabacillus schmidteae TaxID=2730405 RepID=UPI000C805C8B|nr:hypothetical protein [Metabacillus schmidteae]PMC39052.1 hypothetical protein CJ195_03685 [Bacillus sp. UMB0899]
MAVVKKKPTQKSKKDISFMQKLRPIFLIIFCLFIVYVYYLSTIDQLLPQIIKIFSALISYAQSIPTSILLIIGYTLIIFYVGFIVGKKA